MRLFAMKAETKSEKMLCSHAVKLTLRLAWICQRFANSLLIN